MSTPQEPGDRRQETVQDFTVHGKIPARAVLNWRGQRHSFWTIKTGDDGPFHECPEVTLEQARSISAALVELEKRLKEEAKP